MIAGAAAAQMVKDGMEAQAAEPKRARAAKQPSAAAEHELRRARPSPLRAALAGALRAGADRLAPAEECWPGAAR